MLPIRDNVPTRTFPVVTVALIVANFLVWFWELKGKGVDFHVFRDGYYPCSFDHHCVQPATRFPHLPWYESTFTGMFMHAGWIHILGNMLFFWIFGNNVEGGFGLTHPTGSGGGTAFFAHIGGFAFGLLTVLLVAKRRPLQPKY